MKRKAFSFRIAAFVAAASFIAACGGGGGGGGGGVAPTGTPCPAGYTGTAPLCQPENTGLDSGTLSTSTSTNVAIPLVGGIGGTATFPAASVTTLLSIGDQTPSYGEPPGGNPVLQGTLSRAAQSWGKVTIQSGTTNTPLVYLTIESSASVSFASSPSVSFTLPSASSGPFYLALFTGGAWQTIAGPGVISGTTVTFAGQSGTYSLPAGQDVYLAFYTGGVLTSPSPTPSPTASPTPAATGLPESQSACTTTNSSPQSIARETMASGAVSDPRIKRVGIAARPQSVQYAPGLLEVSYDAAKLGATSANIHQAEIEAGASSLASQVSFSHIGRIMRVLRVSGDLAQAQSKLRSVPAVVDVSRVQLRFRSSTAVSLPNDPYLTQEKVNGNLIGPPFYQVAASGGQWDMHLMCVSHAWGYAQSSGNTFGVTPGVLAGGVKIAIIDTGVDSTHPDLAGKVVYQATYGGGLGLKTASTETDQDGHGTDVAGIAAADTNNNFGFAGSGYNAQIIAERVFGPPDTQGCPAGDDSAACSASTADIASAITDAVNQGAKVINMSLGGSCAGGDSPDEGQAVANAIIAGTVVVAAAGNEGASVLDAPGCDPGVIAVGASGLNDGQTNGSAYTGSNPEYMASYSDYDASNPGTWGVSAPGGDPCCGGNDNDILHWIENLYTSTASDPNYPASVVCTTDPFGETGNCRIEIAGTSMASPHVAGVAALMLGANPNLTPAQIKTDLCETALNISDSHQGCGRVDAYRAVAKALGDSSVP